MIRVVRSMTGYGRCEQAVGGRDIIVEIKSVNHRYFEFSSRTTRGYGFLDDKLKAYVQKKISRGKTDVYVSVETLEDGEAQVLVNHSLASGYVNALRELSERYGLPQDDLTAVALSRYPDILTIHRAPENEDVIWEAVRQTADRALEAFVSMREAEGLRLREDVENRARRILELVCEVEKRSPETVAEYQQRLLAKLQETLASMDVEEQRLVTEAALFADKVAVAEETVRLRSHMDQLAAMLASGEPVGRKLDFLVQEMNREANTIGSKAVDSQIAYLVVEMKSEIEKIREQVQNIE